MGRLINMIYAKIQTNRASLKKYLIYFKYNKEQGEVLMAPRPQVGEDQRYYVAYLIVMKNSANYLSAKRFKGYRELNKKIYSKIVGKMEYFWSVE